jgi:hypothetical protein
MTLLGHLRKRFKGPIEFILCCWMKRCLSSKYSCRAEFVTRRLLAVRFGLAATASSCRFRDVVPYGIGLGSPSTQQALVIALSEWYTAHAQNVVCGDDVEIEVGERKRKDESLRRER